jgi:hypothetical protein
VKNDFQWHLHFEPSSVVQRQMLLLPAFSKRYDC